MENKSNYSSSGEFEELYTAGDAIFKGSGYTYNTYKKKNGYGEAYMGQNLCAQFFKKGAFYKYYIQPLIPTAPEFKRFKDEFEAAEFKDKLCSEVGWSTRKEPDGVIYSLENKKLTILEAKYQSCPGTTYEKIGAADFIRWFYREAIGRIDKNIDVELVYIVNEYLVNEYPDVFRYLNTIGIKYFVDKYPPLSFFGL